MQNTNIFKTFTNIFEKLYIFSKTSEFCNKDVVMVKNILFWPDVHKEQGHWLPTLKWAQVLHDQREDPEKLYSVSYMGIPDCESIIQHYNTGDTPPTPDSISTFPFHSIFQNMYPKGYTTASSSDPNERWKTWHIWAILYSQFTSISDVTSAGGRVPNEKLWEDAQSLRSAITTVNPDLLVSGYFTSLESLLIHRIYNIPVVISTTYLRHPQDDPAIRARVNLQSFSKPELYKIINMATRGEISTETPEIDLQEFVRPLETFHELIPCPREYEYDHYRHGDLVHYVDPCITKELANSNPSLNSDGKPITWRDVKDENGQIVEYGIIDNKSKIIFVTAGSQVLDYEDKAKNLFHSMCKAMQSPQLQDCFLIIAAGPKLVNSPEWKDYDKSQILIASWVPQRELLSDGDIKCAIIHGGLATIKECIYFKRNFVINPLGKDQIDNALRLRHLGLNNMLSMANVNTNSLLDAINRVTSDYRIHQKIEKLGNTFKEIEDADQNGNPKNIMTGFKIINDMMYPPPPEPEQDPELNPDDQEEPEQDPELYPENPEDPNANTD